MEEKILVLDRDASTIISTGTIGGVPGYSPRITEEVHTEISNHGINLPVGTYLLDSKSPKFSDFTLSSDTIVSSQYTFNTDAREFFIEKFMEGKSSYVSLCGNSSHRATIVIKEVSSRVQFGLCAAFDPEHHKGDFSRASGLIFYPEHHSNIESPKDICQGRALKNISELIKTKYVQYQSQR